VSPRSTVIRCLRPDGDIYYLRLTFPHYRMSSLREIGGASRSILGPYAN
jgi:hypothetical protein